MIWLCLLLLLLGCSAPPSPPGPTPPARPADVQGYETTRFGMQPAEVKKALGWPVAPCAEDPRRWCVDSYDVAGYSCKLVFEFEESGLSRVVLTGAPRAQLLQLETQRYGPPDGEGEWRFPSCHILLTEQELVYSRI